MCGMHTEQLLTYLIILVMMRTGRTVKINELKVPGITKHGASVVLDCDYTLEDSADHSGLVVKWFFNERPQPVYQWIPGTKKPQGLGILKGKLNLDYKASKDENTMHRALHIPKPSVELSGEYTCVVSTFQNEDRQTKSMLVFVPETNFRLSHERSPEGELRLMCSADSVYPRPTMAISLTHRELSGTRIVHRANTDGTYDVKASVTLPGAQDSPTQFSCELGVPEANYTVRKESVYYPGSGCHRNQIQSWLLLIMIPLLI